VIDLLDCASLDRVLVADLDAGAQESFGEILRVDTQQVSNFLNFIVGDGVRELGATGLSKGAVAKVENGSNSLEHADLLVVAEAHDVKRCLTVNEKWNRANEPECS
jgi:hypothetical protein